jgi:hypothetical protein
MSFEYELKGERVRVRVERITIVNDKNDFMQRKVNGNDCCFGHQGILNQCDKCNVFI